MSTGRGQHTATYQIRAKGQLNGTRARAFEGLWITAEGDGILVFTGPVVGQSALYGLLNRIRCAGLTLLSIQRIVAKDCLSQKVWSGCVHRRPPGVGRHNGLPYTA